MAIARNGIEWDGIKKNRQMQYSHEIWDIRQETRKHTHLHFFLAGHKVSSFNTPQCHSLPSILFILLWIYETCLSGHQISCFLCKEIIHNPLHRLSETDLVVQNQ